jgi:hypothetical protein
MGETQKIRWVATQIFAMFDDRGYFSFIIKLIVSMAISGTD